MSSDRSDHKQEIREGRFKADTSRRHSKSKARAQVRHVLEVGTVMCPLAALFVWIMSLFVLSAERAPYYRLALKFVMAGMVFLLGYLWARSEKKRRQAISDRNRALRHQHQYEALQREREAMAAKRRAEQQATEAAGTAASEPAPFSKEG
jgi:ABC-type nickel/cobalt efflux system permease component RcnA